MCQLFLTKSFHNFLCRCGDNFQSVIAHAVQQHIKLTPLCILFSVFVLMCIAALICASQYAGDKSKTQLEGSGFQRVYYEDIKNSCINFFGMLK